jgi:toxin-antitoxin system PIN domain toxin
VIAPDVNVLLCSLREESERHAEYRLWFETALNGAEPVALFEPVLASVLRIATRPAIYKTPTPREAAERFLDTCLSAPAVTALRAGEHHWSLFRDLCRRANCRGNHVQDAYLTACCMYCCAAS